MVGEGDTLEVNLLENKDDKGKLQFSPLLVVANGKTTVGQPLVEGIQVIASVEEADVKGDKVRSIRYKAKKRVRKVRGHRQRISRIKITSIK